ncbi:protein kinase, partial [Oculatella sp. LEGE 06141]|uniref:protein kinase n=1 Tax=Oculatella sp. LEGE 06141 TaxID=1828648 RepID=UPI0030D7046A
MEQLYIGARTIVYRAVQTSTQDSVIIKLLQQDHPSFNDLLQFRNQYTITKHLNLPGIVRPHSLEVCGHSYALVMEDTGGVSLNHYLQTHPLGLHDILAIAIQ